MKIYVSSTYKDLTLHRAAVATALRKAEHTVLAMEDYAAQDSRPLDRCVAHVQSADLYIGLFAWRYGYIPDAASVSVTLPPEIVPGLTSITEAEYIAAGLKGLPRLIFLAPDTAPWPPVEMDAHTGEGETGRRIAEFRAALTQSHIVGFFDSPADLAAQVLAAVQRRDLTQKLELKTLQPVDASPWMMNSESHTPYPLHDTNLMTITQNIEAMDDEAQVTINLGTGKTWWSTRLYFLASLLVDLTDARLLVFVDAEGRFFGSCNAVTVRDALARRMPAVQAYEATLALSPAFEDITREIDRRGMIWSQEMATAGGEESVKTWLRKQELRRFLADALVQGAVDWPAGDDGQAAVMTVLETILHWPQDLVPVIRDGAFYKVVERTALTDEIARLFVEQRMAEARAGL